MSAIRYWPPGGLKSRFRQELESSDSLGKIGLCSKYNPVLYLFLRFGQNWAHIYLYLSLMTRLS